MEYKMGTAPAEWKPAPRVCRCCLSEGCYKDISTEYYWLGEKEMYSQMLKECFDLTISLSEAAGNSRLICEVCITRLRDASNFKKQVINSEKRFAEHLRSGASLSVVEVQENPVLVDIKIEGVKDETAISDDDPDPVDDDIGDPDYDESDDLPLKFEVQKKESMTELSFGDEIPALNTSETTIRKVSSRTKEKSALKKLKMNKKELTIKPVKAGSSKKKDKEAKAKVKAAKPGPKKGSDKESAQDSATTTKKRRLISKLDSIKLIESSTAIPFRWYLNRYRCFCCDVMCFNICEIRSHTIESHKPDEINSKALHVPKGVQIKVEVTDLACKLCSSPIRDIDSLKSHLSSEHKIAFDDEDCDELVPFKLANDFFDCALCSKRLSSFHLLNQHSNTHFSNKICDICGASFANNKRYLTHKSRHRISGILECETCHIVFETQYRKSLHMAKVHDRKVSKHRCPHCQETFTSHYSRTVHMVRLHGAPKPDFKCQMCAKSYIRMSALNQHVKTAHLNEKPHGCSVCGKKFTTGSSLRKHAAVHTEISYSCELCHKSFTRRDVFKQHCRTHATDMVKILQK